MQHKAGEQLDQMLVKGRGDCLHCGKAAVGHMANPLAEEVNALGCALLGSQLDKLFLVGPSPCCLQVDL
jgi:hypothetical protein